VCVSRQILQPFSPRFRIVGMIRYTIQEYSKGTRDISNNLTRKTDQHNFGNN
jgi:hypothetical protein